MAGKLISLHRTDLPGDGRRHAQPVRILPKNPERTGATLSLVNLGDRTKAATIFIGTSEAETTAERGWPLRTSDGDVFLPLADELWAISPNTDVLTIRVIEEEV